MSAMQSTVLFAALSISLWIVQCKVEMNSLFSDGLTLQTNNDAGYRSFVYGTSSQNETIRITGNIQGAPYSINANNKGLWKIEINPSSNFKANFTMNVIGENNKIQINNITMGDVLLCIGSNNMLYPINDIYNASYYITNSINYPSIKIAKIPTINANKPQNMYESLQNISWKQANPHTLPSFSAVCYLSALKLLQMYSDQRSMALIQVAVNDSTLNCWMSQNAINKAKTTCNASESVHYNSVVCNDSTLFNGMINPLIKQTYRASIYYQGKNEPDSSNYGCRFGIMMNDYRNLFGNGDFPFAYIQAGSKYNNNIINKIRNQQTMNQPKINGTVDITGMILSYDLNNNHSAAIAQRVGLKLARIAPVLLYDHNSSIYDGPYIYNAIYNNKYKSISLNFSNLNNKSLILKPVLNCSEGCCSANNVFQVSNDNINWFNVISYTVNQNNSNIIEVITNMNNVKYIRYAYSSFVECGIYRKDNSSIPSAPFSIALNNNNVSITKKIHETAHTITTMSNIQQRCAQTPPMGFNHWNFAHCNIDERLVKQIAEFMINSGLRDVGYEYFNLDDCWMTDREYKSQIIIADSVRFPSGMKSLSNWLKSKNFRFGIYTASAQYTCQKRYGSYMYEDIDVETYCLWGVEYIKLDLCKGKHYQYPNESWIKFRNAINKCYNETGQDMVLAVNAKSACTPISSCSNWIGNITNTWTTNSDIQDNWNSMISNADNTQSYYKLAGPGHWNNADMLEIGNSGMNLNEEKVHFSLWSIIASPLLIGTNLLSINNDSLNILLNKEVIDINQDIAGIQGHKLYSNKSGSEIWFKPLHNSNVAVCLLNRMNITQTITLNFSNIGISSTTQSIGIRDLWLHKDLGNFSYSEDYNAEGVCSHCCQMLKLTPYS